MKKTILIVASAIVVAGVLSYLTVDKTGSNPSPTPSLSSSGSPSGFNSLQQLGPTPSANASQTEKSNFATKLRTLAVSTNSVDIGKNCSMSPSMISVKSGYNLTFKNIDTADHGLNISEQIKLPAGKETTIKAVFKGPGVYGINCDGANIVGFIDLRE
ncbi:MAG: hypothetical protein AAB638_01535 [Patescibacteria group bacterium]